LDKQRTLLSNSDPIFDSHTLPWAIQRGSSFALTHKILGASTEQKLALFYACCAVAGSVSATVIPDLVNDRIKFKARCVENERYINLQITHPLYTDKEARARVLASCTEWAVCKPYGGDQSWINLNPAIWKVVDKYCEFMGHEKVQNTEKPAPPSASVQDKDN